MIDLHIHSSFSDGKHTPNEIIELSRKLGINTISITDHYSLEAYGNIKSFPDDIKLIPGIEFGEGDVDPYHILGYKININYQPLVSALKKINKNKMLMLMAFVKILKKRGINLYAEKWKWDKKLDIGTLLSMLVKNGYAQSTEEALNIYKEDLYLLSHQYCLSAMQKIHIIKEAGGISVFAHPCKTISDNMLLQQRIYEFKKAGLDGIEVFHPSHNKQHVTMLLRLSKQFDLLIAGGSDFHESKMGHQKLGLYKGVPISGVLI